MSGADIYPIALQKCFLEFRDVIDPMVVRGHLFQRGAITTLQMREIKNAAEHRQSRTQSAENLLLYFIEERPNAIQDLIDILPETGYSFLVDSFNKKLVEADTVSINTQIKLDIFTDHRKTVIAYRHKLKLLSHRGDLDEFNELREEWIWKWNNTDLSSLSEREKKNLSDMYFMTLDALLEHRRVMRDRNLIKDTELFKEVRLVAAMTSEPVIATMMYLARYGSSKLLNGLSLKESIYDIEEALSKFELIPACRETGIVLYIFFNMISSKYEQNPTEEQRSLLLATARDAINHFGREDEDMGQDFKRMVLIKIADVHLGIGVFSNDLENVPVEEENLKLAKECLDEVTKKEMWDKMEVRWKMFYYVAMTKYNTLSGNQKNAYQCAQKAKYYADRGRFAGEGENIAKNLARLKEQCILCIRS